MVRIIIALALVGCGLAGCVHAQQGRIDNDRLHRACTDLRIHDVACPGVGG